MTSDMPRDAYSVIDRSAANACIQIEVPAKCAAIGRLLKAMDHGPKVRRPALRPVVSYDQNYHVPERRQLPNRRDGYEVTEVVPRRGERDGYKIIEVASRRREGRRRTEDGDQSKLLDRGDGCKIIEVAPQRREERGRRTEGEDQRREYKKERRQQGELVIVYAEPDKPKCIIARDWLFIAENNDNLFRAARR